MKRSAPLMLFMMALLVVAGCSDDDGPTGTTPVPNNTTTSEWNTDGYWVSTVDASDYDSYMGFSFATQDTTLSGVGKALATGWDIAFRREAVKLNGGSSTANDGDCEGTTLGVVDFDAVTIADTAGLEWSEDAIDFFIDDWYDYNPQTHQLTANRNVYSMVDAEGDNYVKFQIDSMVGAGMPPDMGTIYLTYFYQATASSNDLSGATVSTSIAVGTGTAYFDFSSGAVVTPADPSNSTAWDLGFSSYNVMQNSGPNGSGQCAAFPAYTELATAHDIAAFTSQPSGAPMFGDIPQSVLTEWYTYTGPPSHQLLSNNDVYLIRTGGLVYKLKIESYYGNVGGVPTSGWYTFHWAEL